MRIFAARDPLRPGPVWRGSARGGSAGPSRRAWPGLASARRQRMRRADREFLPSALAILETPPSPLGLGLMGCISALAAVALVWAYVGRIDVMAIAQGKVQALGRTKVVQPLEAGRVRTILVENGRRVRAGDVLVELDTQVSRAEEATLQANLSAFLAEAVRRRAALSALARIAPVARDSSEVREASASEASGAAPTIRWDDDVPADVAAREQQIFDSDVAGLATTVAALSATVRERTAERDRLLTTIAAQERLIGVLRERVGMRTTLLDKAIGSRSNVLDSLESLEVQQTQLTSMRGQAAQAAAAIDVARREIDKSLAAFARDNSQRLSDAERQAEETRTRLVKARLITDHAVLRSPIDGVVQGLSVLASGQVVQSGEQIMQVVPSDGTLEVEAYLLNQDVGFVQPGQEAIVKLEAFPFTRYGTIPATVSRVAEDAIPEADARRREESTVGSGEGRPLGGAQRTQNLVFPMTVRLSRGGIDVDGRTVRLMPGMAVTVEVRTGSRRILEYLFSPLVEVFGTALRER